MRASIYQCIYLLSANARPHPLNSPGKADYARGPYDPFTFIQCSGLNEKGRLDAASKIRSYAGAWLSTPSLLQAVDLTPASTLEWHSHTLYEWVIADSFHRGAGAVLKTADLSDFYVNHLSLWGELRPKETRMPDIARMASAADRECSGLKRELDLRLVHKKFPRPLASRTSTMVLVPFWGGTSEASGGNAHSLASRGNKAKEFAGTICSALRSFAPPRRHAEKYYSHSHNTSSFQPRPSSQVACGGNVRVTVGVCSAEDRNTALEKLRAWGITPVEAARVLPMSADAALEIMDDEKVRAFIRSMKIIPLPRDRRERLAALRASPEAMKSMPKVFNASSPVKMHKTPSTTQISANTTVVVLQFDCHLGVHLPFHLLQVTQLLTKVEGKNKTSPLEPPINLGNLFEESWGDIGYVYFTEADQLTSIKDGRTLRSLKAVLNRTTYVVPHRLDMRKGPAAGILNEPGFESRGLVEMVQSAMNGGPFIMNVANECREGPGNSRGPFGIRPAPPTQKCHRALYEESSKDQGVGGTSEQIR